MRRKISDDVNDPFLEGLIIMKADCVVFGILSFVQGSSLPSFPETPFDQGEIGVVSP